MSAQNKITLSRKVAIACTLAVCLAIVPERITDDMARGNPDWNVPVLASAVPITENADMFATLNGFSRVDNRGRIVWFDDFREGVFRWEDVSDAGALSPIHVFDTGLSYGRTGAALLDPVVNGGSAFMVMQTVIPVSQKMGIEIAIRPLTNFSNFTAEMYVSDDEGASHYASMKLNDTTSTVQLRSTNVFTSSLGSAAFVDRWVVMKMTFDIVTDKFDRLVIGNNTYDGSAIALGTGAAGLNGQCYVALHADANDVTNIGAFYVGYVIITADEP